MTRALPAIALGALVALAALAVVLALRTGSQPSAPERAELLAQELRCPDCQGLSVADSPTSTAQEIRRQIDELLAGGASDQAVRDHFVARYGEWILLAPSSPLLWLFPLAVVIAGAVGLSAWLVSRRRPTTAPPALSSDQRRALHDEVEALDA